MALLTGCVTETCRRLSHGLAHLKALQEAGLNHVHLLPSYDYGSVPERPEEQAYVQVGVHTVVRQLPGPQLESYKAELFGGAVD